MKFAVTQLLYIFLLIPPLFSTPFTIKSADELLGVLDIVSGGDSVFIDAGIYRLDTTITWRKDGMQDCPITVFGAGIGNTVIISPAGKTAFDILGSHYSINKLTLRGGKATLSISGNDVQASWIEITRGQKGIVMAGDECKLSHLWVHDCPITGIEVNGGYKYVPEISKHPIRLKIAVQENTYPDHTDYLASLIHSRNMKDTIEYVYINRCGFKGKAINGGGIKAIPFVSGLYIYRTVAKEIGFSAFWIDSPSLGKNEIIECYAENARHGVHIELADSGEVNLVKNCTFNKVGQGIFNSSSQNSLFENNKIYASTYGIVNHGIKGNRVGRSLDGMYKDNSIFLEKEGRAHIIWYTGKENKYSYRNGNQFLAFEDQKIKIGETRVSGYGGIKDASEYDLFGDNEQVMVIDSLPNYSIPNWKIPGLKN